MIYPICKRYIFLLYLIAVIVTVFCDVNPFAGTEEIQDNGGLVWIEYRNSGVDSTIYYVSPSGSDDADGKGETTAFQTIARAMEAVRPGGEVRILQGTYYEALGILNGGDSDIPITITGYKGSPILDGQNSRTIGFLCEESRNLIFNNLTFQNYTDIGIAIILCHTVTLQNLVIRENGHRVQLRDWELEGYGIHVEESEHILIERNDVYRNGPEPKIYPDYLMGTGINTYSNRHVIISRNRSHENIGGGILVEDSYNVLVEFNDIYRNDLDATVDEWWDGGLWLDGGGNVTIRKNIFWENYGPGIEISDEDEQNPTGYVLENNMSIGNYYGIFIWNFGSDDWPPDSVLRRRCNQYERNTRQDIWIESTY